MKKKSPKKTDGSLFSETSEPWTVLVAVYPADAGKELCGTVNPGGLHKLCHKRVVVAKGKGPGELDRLQRLAAKFNKSGTEPRPKVMCAADAPNPDAYLRTLSGGKRRR